MVSVDNIKIQKLKEHIHTKKHFYLSQCCIYKFGTFNLMKLLNKISKIITGL